MKSVITVILALLVAPGLNLLHAQARYLDRKISLDIRRCSVETALVEIARAGSFRLSYDATLVNPEHQVAVSVKETSVKKVLQEILGDDVRPKEVGSHVILVRERSAAKEAQPYDDLTVTGVVLDASTRMPLAEATLFEVVNRRSAVTGKDGSYSLVIPSGKKIRSITFCKAGYDDTVVFIRQARTQQVSLLLQPEGGSVGRLTPLPAAVRISQTDSLGLVKWLVPDISMINARNLDVRTSAPVQVSLIPYISTNWKVTGSVTNHVSVNLLAGYTGGVDGVEVGGLLNVNRNAVKGVQIGGLGNITGGVVQGWQVGGLFNYDLGNAAGVQIGGLFNRVPDTLQGVQISGLAGIVSGQIKGVQISGLVNVVTRHSDGWQIAGLTSITAGDVKKLQLSGLLNFGDNLDGVQIAGLVNLARRHNSGVQIAGLLNYATYVHGLQLGLINVTNTVERGVPIGLFSYVQEGYHLFEFSGNEIFYGNVAFKSGTKDFYNFVQGGVGGDWKLQASYGIGTIFTLKRKWSMNVDASAGFVYHPVDTVYHGLLLKVNPAVEYRFAKHFALFGGPAYNFFLFSKGKPSATLRGLSTYDFYFHSTENASIQMWIGGVVGVRM